MIDLDAYDRGARLAPAYLVFSPAIILVVAMSLGTSEWWSKIGGVLVACGAPMLAVQWGRSGGDRKEEALFAKWGGRPTTALLRFATGGSSEAVSHRHATVERAIGRKLPTAAEERDDPAHADALYATAVDELRELTRSEVFPLVLKENMAYGFRRNLWGRKAYGIAVAACVLAVCGGLLVAAALGHEFGAWESAAFAAAFAAVALVLWLTAVTPDWVHEAAKAYATRLLESAIRLPPAGI